MSYQTESIYKDGDIVWVKLNSVWWPGVVKDVEKDGRAEELHAGLRSKPFATVQFFDEESFQFVKTVDDIYYFNSKRKEEFIKKGLDKLRSGRDFMKKFPADVTKAEELSGGDVNILNDVKYAPVEKLKETPVKKETASETLKTPLKKRVVQKFHSAARVAQPRREYQCIVCDFSSDLVGALTSHMRFSHFSQRVDYGPVVPNRQTQSAPPPKKRVKAKTSPVVEKAKSKVPSATPVKRTTLLTPEKNMKRYTDALIADWGEDDEEEGPLLAMTEDEASVPPPPKEEKEAGQQEPPATPDDNAEKPQSLSCFDFDEDEDAKFIGMSDAMTYGRKLPRVIPEKDKSSLGFDPEMDEVFERKSIKNADGSAVKKRRGRPPKGTTEQDKAKATPKATPKKVVELKTLASTRTRRPASRKSYVNEEIRSIGDVRDDDSSADESSLSKKTVAKKKRKLAERGSSGDEEESEKDAPKRMKEKPKKPDQKQGKSMLQDEWLDEEESGDDDVVNDEITVTKTSVRKVTPVKATSKSSPKKIKKVESEESSGDEDETEEATKNRILDALKEKDDDDGLESVAKLLGDDSPVEQAKASFNSKSDEETDTPKPSRRKQDLKRSRMVELDDIILPTAPKKVATGSGDAAKPKLVRVTQKSAPVASVEEADDLEAQVKSFLADTSTPVVPAAITEALPSEQEVMDTSVEYLEEEAEPTPPPPPKPAPIMPVSPVKKWKDDIKSALGSEVRTDTVTIVKKSIIPQWKQGIQEQLNANVTTRVVEKAHPSSPIKIVKGPSIPMGSRIIKLSGMRPRILNKQGDVVISSPRTTPQKIGYIVNSSTSKSLQKPAQSIIACQYRQGGTIRLIQHKVKDGSELSTVQKQALTTTYRDGVARIPDYNGTGQEVKLVSLPDAKKFVRLKSQDPTKKVRLVFGKSQGGQSTQSFILRTAKPKPEPQLVRIAQPEPEPEVIEEQPMVMGEPEVEAVQTVHAEPAPAPVTQQMVVMTQDGGYVLVNVDPNNQQTYADNSLLTYNVVQPDVSEELYQEPAEQQVYHAPASGQDILAEALANTNVLEEVPMMMPSVVQESVAGITMQKPYILSQEVPTVHNSACLLTVQENQKPIMAPIEVPSSIIVADAANLEPPPLPPTPDEDVLMEDEGGLMIAEQPAETEQSGVHEEQHFVHEEHAEEGGEESGSFESMPLLNEDAVVPEEQPEDLNAQAQQPEIQEAETTEFLPSSTNPDLETDQDHIPEEKEGVVPYVAEEGDVVRPQDTEVTSTTDNPT